MHPNSQAFSESTLNSVSLSASKLDEDPPIREDTTVNPSANKLTSNNFEFDYTEKPRIQSGI